MPTTALLSANRHSNSMIQTEVIWPSEPLRHYVHHYWVLHTCGVPMSHIIMPVGCVKWMFHRKRPFRVNGAGGSAASASAVGICEKAIRIYTAEDIELICVFFQPYVGRTVMDIAPHELVNRNIDLGDFGHSAFDALKSRMLSADSCAESVALIDDFLLKHVAAVGGYAYQERLASAFELMAHNMDASIYDLASEACLSPRQFRRVFADNVGINPKQMWRIQRFHMATNLMQRSIPSNLSDILCRFGYTDHSHLNRDFHEIANMSPTDYLAFLSDINHNVMAAYKSYHLPHVEALGRKFRP